VILSLFYLSSRSLATLSVQKSDVHTIKAAGCTHVGMEATGVYWRPIYNLLEGHFELVVANARHIKAVPGHKTDVKDAQWIASLLQHGLLKASFVPSGLSLRK